MTARRGPASVLMESAIVLSAACTDKPAPSASSSPEIHVAVNAAPAPRQASPGMVWIPGGTFRMGCDDCGMLSTDLTLHRP